MFTYTNQWYVCGNKYIIFSLCIAQYKNYNHKETLTFKGKEEEELTGT